MAEYMKHQISAAMHDFNALAHPACDADTYALAWIRRNAARFRSDWIHPTAHALYRAVTAMLAAETFRVDN